MLRVARYALGAFVVGAGLLAVGCQSSGANAKPETAGVAAATDQAVACDKCKVTWVKAPVTTDKGRVIAYTTKQSHECPDCRAAVTNFFTTGKLQHTCATCGDALQVCEAHTRR
jgi:hypothetical protein